MSRLSGPSTMYSGTVCDLCGGPTLAFPSGSIWCPDEDAHAGGHFVVRVAFERSPLKGGTPLAEGAARGLASIRNRAIKPRAIKPPAPATVSKPGFASGYDDFVKSE